MLLTCDAGKGGSFWQAAVTVASVAYFAKGFYNVYENGLDYDERMAAENASDNSDSLDSSDKKAKSDASDTEAA